MFWNERRFSDTEQIKDSSTDNINMFLLCLNVALIFWISCKKIQKVHAVLNSFSRKASLLLSFYYVSSKNLVIHQLLFSLYTLYICEFAKLELKGRIKLSEFSSGSKFNPCFEREASTRLLAVFSSHIFPTSTTPGLICFALLQYKVKTKRRHLRASRR